jgi:Protein of unknown function (DUF3095)
MPLAKVAPAAPLSSYGTNRPSGPKKPCVLPAVSVISADRADVVDEPVGLRCLRMILDCTPDVADAIEKRLVAAALTGTILYGLHRQDAAVMTCFAPSPADSNHIHFIDGARGGYASAATLLKEMTALSKAKTSHATPQATDSILPGECPSRSSPLE